nr:hypothetical protein [Pandoravirus aubagnensis]
MTTCTMADSVLAILYRFNDILVAGNTVRLRHITTTNSSIMRKLTKEQKGKKRRRGQQQRKSTWRAEQRTSWRRWAARRDAHAMGEEVQKKKDTRGLAASSGLLLIG